MTTSATCPHTQNHSLTHESALKSAVFWDATQILKPPKMYETASWLTPAAFPVLPTCSVNEYVCASGGCVSASLRCDGHDNCLDGSDEVSRKPPPPPLHRRQLHSSKQPFPNPQSPLIHYKIKECSRGSSVKGWKALTPVASCPDRSAAWKSVGRTSSSAWTEHTASRGVGAVTTSSTAWTTATRKTAARVGTAVDGFRRQDSVSQMT